MEEVFGDAESFEDLEAGGGFLCVDPDGVGLLGPVGEDEVAKDEDEMLVRGITIISLGFEVDDKGSELGLKFGFDRIEGLEEFDRVVAGVCRIVEQGFFVMAGVVEDGARKFLFKEDG